jgi:hypothetical protein
MASGWPGCGRQWALLRRPELWRSVRIYSTLLPAGPLLLRSARPFTSCARAVLKTESLPPQILLFGLNVLPRADPVGRP